MIELTDTHCHLYREYFDDLPQVLARMKDAGVTLALVPGYDIRTSLEAIELSETEEGILSAAGVHPNSEFASPEREGTELRRIFRESGDRISAVGETGIDLYHTGENLKEQRELFRTHLEIAREFDKPVIIHTRKSASEVVGVLAAAGFKGRGIFHCYDGSPELLQWAMAHGFGISFAGNLTFPKAKELRMALADVPDNLVLVETDSPFLAPQAVRGKRNEPSNVHWILREVAGIKEWTLEAAAGRIRENFFEILGL